MDDSRNDKLKLALGTEFAVIVSSITDSLPGRE